MVPRGASGIISISTTIVLGEYGGDISLAEELACATANENESKLGLGPVAIAIGLGVGSSRSL